MIIHFKIIDSRFHIIREYESLNLKNLYFSLRSRYKYAADSTDEDYFFPKSPGAGYSCGEFGEEIITWIVDKIQNEYWINIDQYKIRNGGSIDLRTIPNKSFYQVDNLNKFIPWYDRQRKINVILDPA